MRIHTDKLTESKIYKAVQGLPGVSFVTLSTHGSRTHARAFEVILTGASPRQRMGGTEKAATWDEWGVFLSRVFAADPSAKIPRSYFDADHFHWVTNHRFSGMVMPLDTHPQHSWTFDGESPTGSFIVHSCRKCGARQRRCTESDWTDRINA